MGPEFDVVVVGAGQAGLSVSHELAAAGVEHVVLERNSVGTSWAGRWDSFCLVTPNHTIRLPGGGYAGGDPHGFLTGAEVNSYLQGYAAAFDAPVRTGVDVQSLWRSAAGRLELGTGEGTITARAVVVATGAYQRALRPAPLAALPPWLAVLDAEDYRNPGALPDGAVLVVGSGQSGCQIAEELCLAGRHVVLACGRAAWIPRRLDGRDIIDWLLETPFLDASVADLPNPMARLAANFQNTGVAGGHDLNYRTMSRLGVDLVGRLIGVDDAEAAFADDLAESVAFGDARYADVCAIIGASCGARGLAAPDMPDPPPFTVAGRDLLSLRGFGSVVVAAGYRPAWTGSSTRRRSMTSGSRCTATAPARWWRGCTSSASTSCGSGSRHCSSAWVKTPAWLPSRSPASAGPGTGTLPKGTPTPASPAPARADAQVSERIEQILASEVGSSRGHH